LCYLLSCSSHVSCGTGTSVMTRGLPQHGLLTFFSQKLFVGRLFIWISFPPDQENPSFSGVKRGGHRVIGPGRRVKNSKNPIQRGAKNFFKGRHFLQDAKILIWPRATNTFVTPLPPLAVILLTLRNMWTILKGGEY